MNRRKGMIIVIVAALAVCICLSGIFVTGQIARSNSISGETAQKIACADADIPSAEAAFTRTEFGNADGIYFYQIEFVTADGTFYYKVNARTGQILEKEIPEISQEKSPEKPAKDDASSDSKKSGEQQKEESAKAEKNRSGNIGVEKAKKIALADAGLKASEVVFSKAKQETEGKIVVYELKFFVEGISEYEYEIDALTGNIREKNVKPWETEEEEQRSDDSVYDAEVTETPVPTSVPTAAPTSVPEQPVPQPTAAPTEVPAPPAEEPEEDDDDGDNDDDGDVYDADDDDDDDDDDYDDDDDDDDEEDDD